MYQARGSHRSPMGKPSHPVSYVRSHVSHIGLRYRPGQHWWYCQQRSDPSSDIDSGPNLKGYGASAPLLSTDSSLQSYHTANTSLSSPTSTCSSNPVSLPYTVTSVHSYKSNKKVLYPRCEREHPPPVALSSQDHVPDPHQPPRHMETGWTLRFRTTEKEGSPVQAWMFYIAVVLFPLWWVGAVWRVPKMWVVGGTDTEEQLPLDDSQIEFDARSWRFRCRVMAAISLVTYVPLIVLVAIFESR